MNLLNPKLTASEWRAALTASERLWPEAALAPEVPSEAELERYLETGPSGFHPAWLRAQIEESAACQRALEDLRLRRLLGRKDHLTEAFLKAGFRLSTEPHLQEPHAVSPLQVVERHEPIQMGELRRTEEMVFVFTGEGLKYRRTFRPLLVAVVQGPLAEGEQEYWRGVVCTPAQSWSEEDFCDDEILVRSAADHEYVAHLWLEFPISTLQFAARMGALEPKSVENLQFTRHAHAEGLPLSTFDAELSEGIISGCRLDPEKDAAVFLERAQLHDCATWLTATLDAQIQADRERDRALGIIPAESTQPLPRGRRLFRVSVSPNAAMRSAIHEGLALAAKTPGSLGSQALVVRGSPENLVRERHEAPHFEQALPPKTAEIITVPSETTAFSGPAFAQWDVSELISLFHPPCQLLVLAPGLGTILADGYVREGVASAIGCDWDQCRTMLDKWEDWVLLIFDPSP